MATRMAVHTQGHHVIKGLAAKMFVALVVNFHVAAIVLKMVRSRHQAIVTAIVAIVENGFSELFPLFGLQVAPVIRFDFHAASGREYKPGFLATF